VRVRRRRASVQRLLVLRPAAGERTAHDSVAHARKVMECVEGCHS
jgi:hypothetical protein